MADPPPDIRTAPIVAAVLPIPAVRPGDEEQARLDHLLQRARADTYGNALAAQLAEISERLRERPGDFEEMLALIERRSNSMEAEIERRVADRAALLERDAETRRAVEADARGDMLRMVMAMRDESQARNRELETAAGEAAEREEQLRAQIRAMELQKEEDDRILGQVLTEFVRQGADLLRAEASLSFFFINIRHRFCFFECQIGKKTIQYAIHLKNHFSSRCAICFPETTLTMRWRWTIRLLVLGLVHEQCSSRL